MKVGVVNASTLVDNATVRAATEAVKVQVRRDLAPAWGLEAPTVRFFRHLAEAPPDWCVVAVLDDADQAGAAGYHSQAPDGRPYGRVFARVTLDAGNGWLRGPMSLSCILSHEVCEVIVDPACGLWAESPTGHLYALEVCDPVQASTYAIGGVDVSDFALPAFFDAAPESGARLSHLGTISAPFELAPGGYAVVRTAGRERDVFGATPAAHKAHPASRTARRRCPA